MMDKFYIQGAVKRAKQELVDIEKVFKIYLKNKKKYGLTEGRTLANKKNITDNSNRPTQPPPPPRPQ